MAKRKAVPFYPQHTIEQPAPGTPEEERQQVDLAQAMRTIQAAKQAQVEQCNQEIEAVLAKYGLNLEVGHVIRLVPR